MLARAGSPSSRAIHPPCLAAGNAFSTSGAAVARTERLAFQRSEEIVLARAYPYDDAAGHLGDSSRRHHLREDAQQKPHVRVLGEAGDADADRDALFALRLV